MKGKDAAMVAKNLSSVDVTNKISDGLLLLLWLRCYGRQNFEGLVYENNTNRVACCYYNSLVVTARFRLLLSLLQKTPIGSRVLTLLPWKMKIQN